MAKNNTILLTPDRAIPVEGIISGTPKPGTVMEIDYSVALQGNRPTLKVYQPGADGENPRGPHIILKEDHYQGKTMTDAYVSGTRGFGFIPLPGCEFNGLHENVTGTADDVAIDDKMMVDTGTGMFKVTAGSPENEVAQALEARVDPTADGLIHMIWTGH